MTTPPLDCENIQNHLEEIGGSYIHRLRGYLKLPELRNEQDPFLSPIIESFRIASLHQKNQRTALELAYNQTVDELRPVARWLIDPILFNEWYYKEVKLALKDRNSTLLQVEQQLQENFHAFTKYLEDFKVHVLSDTGKNLIQEKVDIARGVVAAYEEGKAKDAADCSMAIADVLSPVSHFLHHSRALQQWDDVPVREAWQGAMLHLHQIGLELSRHYPKDALGHTLSHPVCDAIDTILSQQVFTRLSAPAVTAAYEMMAQDNPLRKQWEGIKGALAAALHQNYVAFSQMPEEPAKASDHVGSAVGRIAESLNSLRPSVVKERRNHFRRAAAENPELIPLRDHWDMIEQCLRQFSDTLSVHAADLKSAAGIALKFDYGHGQQTEDPRSRRWTVVITELHATAGKISRVEPDYQGLEGCAASLHGIANDFLTNHSKTSVAPKALQALGFISDTLNNQAQPPRDLLQSIRAVHDKIVAAQQYRSGLQQD